MSYAKTWSLTTLLLDPGAWSTTLRINTSNIMGTEFRRTRGWCARIIVFQVAVEPSCEKVEEPLPLLG